ncbi:MAG TPA: aminodeoxychorismate lyase, partial [Epsilonproteobacteria bacterium]|nr:aminodeoxychorismate lyase [Campylobacterota bacterium]
MAILRTTFWISLLEKAATLLIITLAFYIVQPIQTTQTLFVPQGSIGGIITHLHQKGYKVSVVDKYLLMMLGKPQSGWVEIGATELTRLDFLYKLATAKAKMQKLTLIPGETKVIFFESIAKSFSLDAAQLHRHYDTLSPYPEAGIYAETYHVPYGINEKQLITFLVQSSNQHYKEISEKVYGTYREKQWLRILTIASIIQKEAANNQEMPLVSSAIYNRLKKGMP